MIPRSTRRGGVVCWIDRAADGWLANGDVIPIQLIRRLPRLASSLSTAPTRWVRRRRWSGPWLLARRGWRRCFERLASAKGVQGMEAGRSSRIRRCIVVCVIEGFVWRCRWTCNEGRGWCGRVDRSTRLARQVVSACCCSIVPMCQTSRGDGPTLKCNGSPALLSRIANLGAVVS